MKIDAFGIHALAGMWGVIATGFFANLSVNTTGTGALYGNLKRILTQILGVVITIVFFVIGTFLVFKISSLLTGGGRVDTEEENTGLDETIHGEKSFTIGV